LDDLHVQHTQETQRKQTKGSELSGFENKDATFNVSLIHAIGSLQIIRANGKTRIKTCGITFLKPFLNWAHAGVVSMA